MVALFFIELLDLWYTCTVRLRFYVRIPFSAIIEAGC